MATEFARWSTSNQYGTYSYVLSYDLLSQSIANNTSTIRVYGTINLPVYISWSRGSININGVSFGLATYYSAGSYTIGYTDITVYHDNAGNGSVYVSGSISTSYLMNGSCGGTVYLPTIPREAKINSAPNFNDEENPTITYTNPAGNSVSSLEACISLTGATDDVRYRAVSKTGTSYTFNLTEAERNVLRNASPNSNSLSVRFFLKTVIGGNTLFSISNKTMTIINGNPTFSDFEFEDLNSDTIALTGDDQAIIKGYSNIDIRIPVLNKAEAIKGATMSKYRIVVGDYTEDLTYNDSAMVSSSTILKVTTGTINVYAIDSRNNSTLVTKLATREIDYTPATISSSSKIERNDSGVGTSGILTYSGTFWNNSFGDETNAIESVSYEFKPTSSTTWITGTTDITPTISNDNFSFTGIVRSNASDYTFDISTSYDFRITITDKLTTIVYVFTPLASGTPNLALEENGVGIMGAYDNNIGGPAQVGGNPLAYMPIGYIYISTNSTSPEVLFGGTWQQIAKGRTLVGIDTNDSDFNSIGKTGGSKELQKHTHTYVIPGNVNPTSHSYTSDYFTYAGWGSSFHESTLGTWEAGTGTSGNLQPYLVVYMWERTA